MFRWKHGSGRISVETPLTLALGREDDARDAVIDTLLDAGAKVPATTAGAVAVVEFLRKVCLSAAVLGGVASAAATATTAARVTAACTPETLNTRDRHGRTILDHVIGIETANTASAVAAVNSAIVVAIANAAVAAGADVAAAGPGGWTILHHAASGGHPAGVRWAARVLGREAVHAMCSRDASRASDTTNRWETPLTLALRRPFAVPARDVVIELLRLGARVPATAAGVDAFATSMESAAAAVHSPTAASFMRRLGEAAASVAFIAARDEKGMSVLDRVHHIVFEDCRRREVRNNDLLELIATLLAPVAGETVHNNSSFAFQFGHVGENLRYVFAYTVEFSGRSLEAQPVRQFIEAARRVGALGVLIEDTERSPLCAAVVALAPVVVRVQEPTRPP